MEEQRHHADIKYQQEVGKQWQGQYTPPTLKAAVGQGEGIPRRGILSSACMQWLLQEDQQHQ